MLKKNYVLCAVLTLCMVICMVMSANAVLKASANDVGSNAIITPGSSEDPLITKSYLDKQISGISFKVIEVQENQKIVFGDSTEFVLRSGNLNVSDLSGNGIADLTDGKNLTDGSMVEANHHMLNPRNDGRGVVATSKTFIMIKGDYTVLNLE